MAAADRGDLLFRRMLLWSGIVHVLALLGSAVWTGILRPPLSATAPVTVVNLVGGAQFERLAAPARKAAEAERPPAAPPPSRKSAPKPAPREHAAPAPRKAKEPAPPALVPSRDAMPPPDPGAAVTERIRQLRAERTGSDRIRELAREAGREKEYRQAIGSIRDRAAHRVDLTKVQAAQRGAPAAGAPGAAGTARATPEQLRYFRELDERVRENWTFAGGGGQASARLKVQIRITIERDGTVSGVRMEQTSGNSYFDDSVLRAIKKASPLPVPPEGLRGGEGYYEVGFRFFGEGGGR